MDVLIMDMDGDVQGQPPLPNFMGKLEILAFSHGVAMQITGDVSHQDRTSGRPIHQDMSVTRHLDAASPLLNQACCEGKVFRKVDIIVGRKNGGEVVESMRYTMKNVIVSSISTSGGGGSKPVESLTLNYNHITWKFTAQKGEAGEGTKISGKWDLSKNSAT